MPPAKDAGIAVHRRFWEQLVAWSADRRVLLGIQGRRALWERLNEMGWPDYMPPECPSALSRAARRAFTNFLTEVADKPSLSPLDIPMLNPEYILDEELGTAVALDFAEHGDDYLIGAATRHSHWRSQSETIRVEPPPPEAVKVVIGPGEEVQGEANLRVARDLASKRLTIVGGKLSETVIAKICGEFRLRHEQIRWLEAEQNKSPNLDVLHGIRVEKDVVICITGAIGHPESDTVLRRSRRGGIEPVLIERRSEIPAALRRRYGKLS